LKIKAVERFDTFNAKISLQKAASTIIPYQSVFLFNVCRTVDGTGLIALASADHDFDIQRFWRDVTLAIRYWPSPASACWPPTSGFVICDSAMPPVPNCCKTSPAENQLLLREIDHRVKNNLQAVQSIIQLQRLPTEVQRSLADRISSTVAVHEQIYRHDEFSLLCARNLITSVVEKLVSAYGAAVTVGYDINEIAVSTDNATPLALLTSELPTNILKYAFADGREGKISTALKSITERPARITAR
jgi:two-component system, sensor histidine kinase PdtaS